MDQVLVQAIDELLMPNQIPNKSALSGADFVPVYPQDGAPVPLNGSSIVRFSLPKYYGKVLATSKGQTGAYFAVTYNCNAAWIGEPWAWIREMRIFVNGVQLPANLYYNHTYSEWLKTKRIDWLRTDAENQGVNFSNYIEDVNNVDYTRLGFAPLEQQPSTKTFIIPLPDNYSILTNKDHVLPLGELSIEVHCVVNNHVNFIGKGSDGTNLTATPTLSDIRMYIPVVDVEPTVYDALAMRLKEADEDETKMLLYPIQNVSVEAQSVTFNPGAGSKNLVFNDVSSSVRLLMAKFSKDPGVGTDNAYKTMTGLNCGITRYNFTIDGKKVQQNDVTTSNENAGAGYDLAYSMYKDGMATYNLAVNSDNSMGAINKKVFDAGQFPSDDDTAAAFNAYPEYNEHLSKSFTALANLDTVSRQDLIGGKQIIKNLTLNLLYDCPNAGANDTVSAPGVVNAYLIAHSNAVIGLSSKKCKLLK